MKKSLLFILMSYCSLTIAEERELIFSGKVAHGGFGGPIMRVTQISNQTQLLLGGYGAWLVNHRFYFGGGGSGSVRDVGNGYGSFSYGGVLLGTFFHPNKSMHYYVDLSLNSGNISKNSTSGTLSDQRSDNFLLLEPTVGVALNVAAFVKVMAGVSYRFVDGVDLPGLSDNDLAKPSLNVSAIFGVF